MRDARSVAGMERAQTEFQFSGSSFPDAKASLKKDAPSSSAPNLSVPLSMQAIQIVYSHF